MTVPAVAVSRAHCTAPFLHSRPMIPRSWVERLFPGLYPAYLHVLRVDPDKLDTVK